MGKRQISSVILLATLIFFSTLASIVACRSPSDNIGPPPNRVSENKGANTSQQLKETLSRIHSVNEAREQDALVKLVSSEDTIIVKPIPGRELLPHPPTRPYRYDIATIHHIPTASSITLDANGVEIERIATSSANRVLDQLFSDQALIERVKKFIKEDVPGAPSISQLPPENRLSIAE